MCPLILSLYTDKKCCKSPFQNYSSGQNKLDEFHYAITVLRQDLNHRLTNCDLSHKIVT